MTDPTVDAYHRLDRLHRSYPLPATCIACRSHTTTSADSLCHACRCDIRTALMFVGWLFMLALFLELEFV